jgi:polar amino acid transport system substrate-binding protein
MFRKLFCAAGLALLAQPALADILVTTEEYPPFNMSDHGEITGTATALVKTMFEKAGIPYHIQSLPWQRAYNMALADKDTCVYSTTVTEERQTLFEWVGPLVHNNWVLFARADRAPPANLEAAKGQVIGGYNGDAITLFLQNQGYTVDVAPRDDVNPSKLLNGRLDYWATGSELGAFEARAQGITGIKPVLTFKEAVMALACNKATDPVVLDKLRAALADIRRNTR